MKLLFATLILFSVCLDRAYAVPADTLKMHMVGVDLLKSQIDLLEREVKGYNKDIKEYHSLNARMKDKENRLKYKVVRQLSKMDTTVAHKTTYTEWQLIKTQKTLEQTNLKLAATEKTRQEKILELGRLSQQLNSAQVAIAKMPANSRTTHESKVFEPKKKAVRAGRNHWR